MALSQHTEPGKNALVRDAPGGGQLGARFL
jgi:hypothetical protein